MTEFQRAQYDAYKSMGRLFQAEAYMRECEERDRARAGLTEEEAREKAEERVYCDMCRADIETECVLRGIGIVKKPTKRGDLERALINALTKEYMAGDTDDT